MQNQDLESNQKVGKISLEFWIMVSCLEDFLYAKRYPLYAILDTRVRCV